MSMHRPTRPYFVGRNVLRSEQYEQLKRRLKKNRRKQKSSRATKDLCGCVYMKSPTFARRDAQLAIVAQSYMNMSYCTSSPRRAVVGALTMSFLNSQSDAV